MSEELFDSKNLSKILSERVKELECLYNISRIATRYKNDIRQALEKIVEEIPSGWQYPDAMQAFLKYGDIEIGTPSTMEKAQFVDLVIGEDKIGELLVYFKESKAPSTPEVFLKEEQALLNQIGHEVSNLIEIDRKNQREKLIQEKLRFNDRLNLLGELTAGIAHELNTPLGNIIGYSELLQKKEKNATKKHDLERILKSAKHAREIVKKLMFFSCDMPSQFKINDLNKLTLDSLDLLKIQLNDKYIQAELDLCEDLPKFNLDAIQMTQVVFNMVLNAIDAMSPFGKIKISTKNKEDHLELIITDNGKGIPEAELPRLFQPFYSSKGNNGTGLGLAVSYGIVQAHGGDIEVESVVGEGTTFTLIFPIKK